MGQFTFLLAVLLAYRWAILVAGTLALIVVMLVLSRKTKSTAAMGCIIPAFVLGMMVLAFTGPRALTNLVYNNGERGEGVVTGSFSTGTLYNEEPVIGYKVLIRGSDGKLTKTDFRTDSFNVYPPANSTQYPGVGARFNVRYLPGHPDYFVIIKDDDSEWARSLRCRDMLAEVVEAQQSRKLAPEDADLAARETRAVEAARTANCI